MIRRLADVAGIGIGLVGLALAAALVSYSPADPSQHFATGSTVRNLLGPEGAVAADNLYRAVGYSAFFLLAFCLAWSWRLLNEHHLPHWRLRLVLAPLALIAGAAAMAMLEAHGPWHLHEGAGGVIGRLALARLSDLAQPIGLQREAFAATIWTAGAALSLYVLALDIDELRLAGRGMCLSAGWTGRHLLNGFSRWLPLMPRPCLPAISVAAFLRRRRSDAGTDRPIHHSGPTWKPPTMSPVQSPASGEPPAPPPSTAENAPMPVDPPTGLVILMRPQSALQPGSSFASMVQPTLPLGDGVPLPPLDLLQAQQRGPESGMDEDALTENARMLESVLEDFGVRGEITTVRPGPVVTLYELQPAPGTKASRVIGLADDVARNMSAISVRIATIRGKNAIGIELPNTRREMVYLRELLTTKAYDQAQNGLPLVLGKDIGGQPVVVNLERMPHLLIAGTTGSGKSVAINVMIMSLLYALPPEKCRLILVDPKMLELSVYDDIPHLLSPVVTDPRKAVVALKWAVREMENRYRAMSMLGVRNIKGYNEKIAEAMRKGAPMTRRVQTGFDPNTGQPVIEVQELDMRPLPYIVVVVDEMADLMLVAGKDIEAAIQRLAQMARAAGIHLIMATQRPSVDVITGTIKANFPTRISFQVTSKVDSRTILGEGGAEQLLGQGDMLYMAGGGRIQRVHGPFVSDEEVETVTGYLRETGEPDYVDSVTEDDDIAAGIPGFSSENTDDLYAQAVEIVARERKASTSFLQRHLKIGYNRAASLIDRMESEGLISPANHVGKREVLMRTGSDGDY